MNDVGITSTIQMLVFLVVYGKCVCVKECENHGDGNGILFYLSTPFFLSKHLWDMVVMGFGRVGLDS